MKNIILKIRKGENYKKKTQEKRLRQGKRAIFIIHVCYIVDIMVIVLYVQEVVTRFFFFSYYIKWDHYFLDRRYLAIILFYVHSVSYPDTFVAPSSLHLV